jgi:hypothetical protein
MIIIVCGGGGGGGGCGLLFWFVCVSCGWPSLFIVYNLCAQDIFDSANCLLQRIYMGFTVSFGITNDCTIIIINNTVLK